MSRRAWLLLFLTLLAAPLAHAGDDDTRLAEDLEGLSGAAALERVKELAADEMKGRKTAFEGGALVENWMLGKMSEFGLHPADAGGTYLEPFTFGAATTVAPIALAVGGKALAYGTDYFDLTYSGSGKVSAEAVFVGYGIARPDAGWDDYAGLDVKGKIVIAIRDVPEARAPEFKEERVIGYKTATAADKGAAGFLLVQDEDASTGTIQDRFHRPALPALWLSGKAADAIFAAKQTTLAALKKSRDEGARGKGFATGVQVSMEVNAKYVPQGKGHNALGAIKGRDPDLKDEIILVGAHMDHLGVGPDGQVFHGADDNASGTAVLIHLADVLTRNRFRPKRTVIFCGFGAEEQGLVGSESLAARYPFGGRIVCVLNMDMVGQGEPVVSLSGGGSYPALQKLMEEALPADARKLVEFGVRTGPGSDHWPFHERGIPAFGISTKGEHPNYHRPQDEVANIKPECLEAAARVVGTLIVKLATHEQPLYDPEGIFQYLLREGPRFKEDHLHEGKLAYAAFYAEEAQFGITARIVNVSEYDDPASAWKALEALEAGEGPVRYRLVRRAADIARAWREGRVALLPRLCCGARVEKDPAVIANFAALGYRWIAPWRTSAEDVHVTTFRVKPVVEEILKARVLVDLHDLPAAQRVEALELLGDHPSILFAYEPNARAGAGLGEHTLPIPSPSHFDLGVSRGLLLGRRPPSTIPLLRTWAAKQPAGWDLPGSEQRRAIRAALGGRLIEWLAKTEL